MNRKNTTNKLISMTKKSYNNKSGENERNDAERWKKRNIKLSQRENEATEMFVINTLNDVKSTISFLMKSNSFLLT